MIKRSSQDDYDASLIYNVYHNSNETYGYRRIKQALLEEYGLVMLCRKFGFQISMSREGTPLDNAVIESFHSRLKNEILYNDNTYNNLEELKQAVFDWIWFYNNKRIKGKRKNIQYINYKEKYKNEKH